MKPILFNTAMVQAILEGRKTTTRRIIKDIGNRELLEHEGEYYKFGYSSKAVVGTIYEAINWCKPKFKIGDTLYVRETWKIKFMQDNGYIIFQYKDGTEINKKISMDRWNYLKKFYVKNGWQPSLFMPKEAARIYLKVTDVRVERLDQMIIADCLSEGIRAYTKDEKLYKYAVDEDQYTWQNMPRNPHQAFKDLWDSTLKKEQIEQYGFNANPWVWVIEFERIDKSEVEQ